MALGQLEQADDLAAGGAVLALEVAGEAGEGDDSLMSASPKARPAAASRWE